MSHRQTDADCRRSSDVAGGFAAAGVWTPFLPRSVQSGLGLFDGWLARCGRRPWAVLALLAAALAVQVSPLWYPAPDGVLYLSIARSMVRGGYVGRLGSHQLAFPPGYPLLISPAFLLADRPFLVLSIIHWGLAVVLMLGVYVWARRQCPSAALLITGLVMVNVSLWNHYRRTLSELAFMTVAVWTVQVLYAARDAAPQRNAWRRALPASAMLLLLGMIREVGVTFAAGFAAALLLDAWRGQLRWGRGVALLAIVALPVTVGVAGFARYDVVVAQRSADQTGTHWDGLVQPAFAGRITEGLRLRINDVGRLLIPGMFKAYNGPGEWVNVNMALYCAACLALAVGWKRLAVRQPPDVFALTVPFYLAAYVVWPFDGATRYALPLLPVLFASLWQVVRSRLYWRSGCAILLLAHLGVACGYWLVKDLPAARACNAQWEPVERLASPVRGDARDVLAANIPDCVRLMIEFSLDRPVQPASSPALGDPHVQWVVLPSAMPAYPGFRPDTTAGGFTLLVRDGGQ